jgi:hypothetical protein|tara:strand:- start:6391 stop:6594 length:204 start_codon:yes stop_codon:yes gene_type:complete
MRHQTWDSNGNLIEDIPATPEEEAEEAETNEVSPAKVAQAIDNAFSTKQARILKRIFGRLIKKGLLP